MELNEILSGLNACKDDISPSRNRTFFPIVAIIILFIIFCGCGNGFGGCGFGGYPGVSPFGAAPGVSPFGAAAPSPTSAVSPFATEAHKTTKKIPVCKVSNYYPINEECCPNMLNAGVSPFSAAAPVTSPYPFGNGFGCGFGGGSWWWIWIIFIFIIFGFGRRNTLVGTDVV